MNKVYSIRINRKNGKFLDQIVIPSGKYPISGPPEAFFKKNTSVIEDETVIRILDSIPFRPGYCFGTADKLSKMLISHGYDAKVYVGWMFIGDKDYPIFHAWVMLEDHLLDPLAIVKISRQITRNDEEIAEDYNIRVMQASNDCKGSERVEEPGRVDDWVLYVGSPDTAENGIKTRRRLETNYPNHKSFTKTVNGTGLTRSQAAFYESVWQK